MNQMWWHNCGMTWFLSVNKIVVFIIIVVWPKGFLCTCIRQHNYICYRFTFVQQKISWPYFSLTPQKSKFSTCIPYTCILDQISETDTLFQANWNMHNHKEATKDHHGWKQAQTLLIFYSKICKWWLRTEIWKQI